MAYSEKVIDHYENPRNVGKFEIDDTVGTGMVGAPACGDVMKLQIKVRRWNYNRCQIQNIRMRKCDCLILSCYRVG
jgi:NifU-like protein involved in Fe-S cluster formation